MIDYVASRYFSAVSLETPTNGGLNTMDIALIVICSVVACITLLSVGLVAFSLSLRGEVLALVS
jgi:hypothetical protein